MPLDLDVADWLDAAVADAGLGDDFVLFRYTAAGPTNRYAQARRVFKAPVTVRGILALSVTKEMLAEWGGDTEGADDAKGMITVLRREIERKFPGTPIIGAINEKDELSYNGKRYRVTKVHYTGQLDGSPEATLLFFDDIPEAEYGV